MLIQSLGDSCPDALRLAVDEARCFSDVFETIKPLSYHSDCFVTLARCRATGFKTVVKAYIRQQLSDVAQKQVAIETRIHGSLDHPNVIPLLLAFEDSQHLYLALQHADGGDLRQHLGGAMTEERVRTWLAVPLLHALARVHDQGIVHRDIKPENVLLWGKVPTLADFGMSVYSRHPDGAAAAAGGAPLTAGGTPLYTAPEVMAAMFKNMGVQHVVGPKNDIWALGLVLLEALTGCHPFSPEQAADGNVLYTIAHCSRVNLPARLSPVCQSFLAAALCRDPEARLDAHALLEHEWLASARRDKSDAAGVIQLAASCRDAPGEYDMMAVVTCAEESWEY